MRLSKSQILGQDLIQPKIKMESKGPPSQLFGLKDPYKVTKSSITFYLRLNSLTKECKRGLNVSSNYLLVKFFKGNFTCTNGLIILKPSQDKSGPDPIKLL